MDATGAASERPVRSSWPRLRLVWSRPARPAPALADRFRARDPAAFEEVFRRSHRRLLRLALRFARDPHAAEDAVAEAFRIALETAPMMRKNSPAAWLAGIVVNRARDLGGEAGRPEPLDEACAAVADERADHDETVGAAERDAIVHREVMRLPGHLAAPLVLYGAEGMSVPQVAEALGITPRTAKERIAEARARLRKVAAVREVRAG